MLIYLQQVDGTLILFGVTDDLTLREHVVETLRKRLPEEMMLREFRYDPDNISLLEGAIKAAGEANGHRVMVSVTGLETLPRDKQSEAIKLLNIQRNRFGRTGLAVMLWLNRALFAEVARKASDFYSWRSKTFMIEPPSDWESLKHLRRSYLQAIIYQNEYVNLHGLAPMRGGQIVQMKMDDVFIPLHVEQEEILELGIFERRYVGQILSEKSLDLDLDVVLQVKEFDKPAHEQLVQRVGRLNRKTVLRHVEISEILRQPRAIILGDPGAGKTTLLRYVAYQLAKSNLNADQRESSSTKDSQLPAAIADCLPVYVRIGLYAQHLKENPDATIADFAPQQDAQIPLSAELLQDAMHQGKALFLLDGLDEIIAASLRREVAQSVDDFARKHPDCPVIVTSRIVGYREASLGNEFAQFTIRPFDDAEVVEFIRCWYKSLGMPGSADSLINSIQASDPIRKLASNPLLLTVIALIHLRNVKLPNRRVELYQKAAETLVDNWMNARRVTPDDWDPEAALKVLLPEIAWHLHTQASGGLIGQDDLQSLLVETMSNYNRRLSEAEGHTQASQFRRNVSEFSGVFLERGLDETGRGLYGFLHLTFEEYFASIKLKDKWRREGDSILKPLLHQPRWTEVILLCAGNMDQFDATQFVNAILKANSEYENVLHRDLMLAARVLGDDVRVDPDLRHLIVKRLTDLYFALQTTSALQDDLRKSFSILANSYFQDEIVEGVGKGLASSEGYVRSAAASALGALGEKAASAAVIDRLVELLADSERSVRDAAASALGALGEKAASGAVIDKLVGLFADDSEWDVPDAAAYALGAMGEKAASAAVIDRWVELLAASEWSVRSAAARALGVLSAKIEVDNKQAMTGLFLKLARKRGKSDRIVAQRDAGYVGLRNIMASS